MNNCVTINVYIISAWESEQSAGVKQSMGGKYFQHMTHNKKDAYPVHHWSTKIYEISRHLTNIYDTDLVSAVDVNFDLQYLYLQHD